MAGVVVVDHGTGNTGSIVNLFRKVGVQANLSRDAEQIRAAAHLVLPGVGAFDDAMRNLEDLGLAEPIRQRAWDGGGPLLGVCLGMQLLLDGSDEGDLPGLGLIPGRCRRLPSDVDGLPLRIPHMGWSSVRPAKTAVRLPSLTPAARYYFVHSYHAVPTDAADVLATSEYGVEFTSAVARDEVLGVQFHPEKSHRYGMQLLAEFAAS